MDQLKERLKREVEGVRETLMEAHKVELEAMRLEGEEELRKAKETLEKKMEDHVTALRRQKEKEHEQVSC